VLEERKPENGEDARERLRAVDRHWRRGLRLLEHRFAGGMFRAPGRHERRRAFMCRTIANVMQELVQLRRRRKGDGQCDRTEKNCGGDCAQLA